MFFCKRGSRNEVLRNNIFQGSIPHITQLVGDNGKCPFVITLSGDGKSKVVFFPFQLKRFVNETTDPKQVMFNIPMKNTYHELVFKNWVRCLNKTLERTPLLAWFPKRSWRQHSNFMYFATSLQLSALWLWRRPLVQLRENKNNNGEKEKFDYFLRNEGAWGRRQTFFVWNGPWDWFALTMANISFYWTQTLLKMISLGSGPNFGLLLYPDLYARFIESWNPLNFKALSGATFDWLDKDKSSSSKQKVFVPGF